MSAERPDLVAHRMRYIARMKDAHPETVDVRFPVERDRPGFWEVRGDSNSAEPWFDDRYSS